MQNQKPVSKSVKLFTGMITLILENFWLCCELPLFFWVFVGEKSDRSSCNKEFGFKRFTVGLAEICLNETVNNESNTNNRTFEYEIKQSNIMTNSNKENTDH